MSDADMMTAEERDRQFTARRGAALAAREVLWGIEEPNAEDIVVVADWLLTGTADVAMQVARQTAVLHGRNTTSSDEASWWPALDEEERP